MALVVVVMEMVWFALLYLTVYCTSAVPPSSGGHHVREMLLALVEELVRFTGVLIGATAECHDNQSVIHCSTYIESSPVDCSQQETHNHSYRHHTLI